MGQKILTSMFPNGFTKEFAAYLKSIISEKDNIVFVASEFEEHDKTDKYCRYFMKMFLDCDIEFRNSCVIDSRMSKEQAQKAVEISNVIWLAGGDTPTQFNYLKQYGLDKIIKEYNGIVIGMSAGAINMAKTAICTLTCKHDEQKIYNALDLVNISVEPHLDKKSISDELLDISHEYSIYGMCDDSVIIVCDDEVKYLGDIFLIQKGFIKQISFSPPSI